jgi:hypothetical protein
MPVNSVSTHVKNNFAPIYHQHAVVIVPRLIGLDYFEYVIYRGIP